MKTTQYKKGVREIITRTREINPLIGEYVQHQHAGSDHFQIMLSNGTITLPCQVAHSQQEFPSHVSSEWITEIANTFQAVSTATRGSSPSIIGKLLNRFRISR